MKIVVAGHICLDIIPEWDRGGIDLIIPGHILEMNGITFSTGGAVANTGLALTKLGVKTALVGKIGDDAIGTLIQNILQDVKSDITDNMIISQGETSSYTIVLNPPDTDRVFLHSPGTNHTFKADDIDYIRFKGIEIFHFGYPPIMKEFYQNDGSELIKVMSKFKEMGVITSLDMSLPDPESPAGKIDWIKYLKQVLPYIDIFLPSIDEMLYMLKIKDKLILEDGSINIELLKDIGNRLLNWGAKIVVIKLGAQGLYLKTGNLSTDSNDKDTLLLQLANPENWAKRELISPCFKTEVVGTTGAGDTTIAGFLAKFLQGVAPEEVMTMATAVGACSVEVIDATGGIKPLEEVEKRVEEGWERLSVQINEPDWTYDHVSGLWRG